MSEQTNFITANKIKHHLKVNPCEYDIILGMRSNGKSSGVKSFCVEKAFTKQEYFFYLRRQDTDMKNWKIESYFKNVDGFDIRKITKGKYENVGVKQGALYFYNTVIKNNKDVREWGELCGYVGALSTSMDLKSLNFPNTKYMIYEEFVTSKTYLFDEPNLLFNLVSTVFRNNNGTVFMVANTISDINPYFREFELDRVSEQPTGTTHTYLLDRTKVNVWVTSPLDDTETQSKMSFGERAKMIKNGEWERTKKRHLEREYKDYKVIYRMVFSFDKFNFLMELLNYNNSFIWYVTKKTTPIQKNTRVITDSEIETLHATMGFIPLTPQEKIIFALLKQGKIAYSDNLTGTQFLQCFKQMERSQIK